MPRASVLDGVGNSFPEGRQEVRKIVFAHMLRPREISDAIANDPADQRIGRHPKIEHRFGTCHIVVLRVPRKEVVQPKVLSPRCATLDPMADNQAPGGAELDALATEAEHVRARVATKKGDIVFRFYPHEAKQHSAAFIKLARAGFYDGLRFHRVEPGFVIQGGDPKGDGTGGPGYMLDAEFSALPHVRGTVAMARAGNPNSAGSQFYVCLGDARFLDKQYTVFGQTVEGQDVVDAIRVGDVMEKVTIEPE